MSLTSYRAAPPRGGDRSREPVRSTGLAVTYSPASWDAVPSARRRLTAEFGMGSGVSLALEPPNPWNARTRPLSKPTDGFDRLPVSPPRAGPVFLRIGVKPVGRLVPVN